MERQPDESGNYSINEAPRGKTAGYLSQMSFLSRIRVRDKLQQESRKSKQLDSASSAE